MKRRTKLLVMVGALLSGGRREAWAQDSAAAEVLYNDAMAARGRKDFATACPKFAESYRLDPTAPTLVMVADCEERDGKLADAWGHLQEALQKLRDPAQIAYAKKLSAGLEKRVPRLTVKLAPGAPDGTVVKRDGVELRAGSLGAALPVNPGEHVIVVTAPGRKASSSKVIVEAGKSAEIGVAVGDIDSAAAAAPAAGGAGHETGPTEDRPEGERVSTSGAGGSKLGYIVGGVGLVGLGVAGVTGLMLSSKRSEMRSANCDPTATPRTCSGPGAENGVSAASSGAPLVPVFNVGLLVGVVGVGAGAYLVLTEKKTESGATTAVRLGPSSVVVDGRF